MKDKRVLKLKLIIILAFVALICLTLTVGFLNQNNAPVLAKTIEITSNEISDEYNINSDVEFPNEIVFDYEGKSVTASSGLLYFPDKTVVAVGTIKLETLGEYTARYFFTDDNGDKFVAQKTFNVTNKMYSVSSSSATITAVTEQSQVGQEFDGNDKDVLFSKDDGLIVRLGEGDTFNYTTSIDLTQVGEDGLCDIISLDYRISDFVKNPKYGNETTDTWKKLMSKSRIATYCVIRLSDSYDSGNYIEMYCRYAGSTNDEFDINSSSASKAYYYPSFSACAVGQTRTALTPPVGVTYATWYNIQLNGTTYGLYKNNEKGGTTFSGIPLTGDHTPFTWKYDYKTNMIYVQQGKTVMPISALSSSEIYGTDTFDGFTNGKVKLSIYMSEYVSGDQGRVDITKIGNVQGSELVDNYGKLGFVDRVAMPVIDLGVEDTDDNGIYAPLNSEFTLPVPNVLSSEKVVSSEVYAYSNYGTISQIDIPIKDGKINIDKLRKYTVLYVVKNAAGCTTTKVLDINPVKVDKPITLSTSFDQLKDISAGERVVLPDYQISGINSSQIQLNITAVHEKETVVVNKDNMTFIPSYDGEYSIVYTMQDNVFTHVETYKLNSKASDKVTFIGNLDLPRYFIKNAEYSLSVVPAYTFINGYPEKADVSAYISYDNGVSFEQISNVKKVKITGDDTAIIKYTCTNGKNSDTIESLPIKIVDVGYGGRKTLRLRDYFIHEGFKALSHEESNSTNVQYDSINTSGNNKLEFVNAIDVSILNFAFKIPAGASNYKCVNVILTDYYDANVKYVISYLANGKMCYVSLNGQTAIKSNYNFADNSITKKLTYNSNLNELTVNDVVFKDVALSETFNSSLCYIDVELIDINGSASIIIDALNLQNFRNNRAEDNVIPQVTIKDFSGEYEIGSVITISKICVTDVLSTIIDENVSFYAEKDGEVLYSVDGVRLDQTCDPFREYQIKLSEFGQYTVSWVVKDGAGKTTSKMCFFSVVDVKAPTITVVNESMSAKVGKLINVEYSVVDDHTETENIVVTVFIKDVKTNAFYTFNNNQVWFANKGEYELYIYAKDASGNCACKIINVTAE